MNHYRNALTTLLLIHVRTAASRCITLLRDTLIRTIRNSNPAKERDYQLVVLLGDEKNSDIWVERGIHVLGYRQCVMLSQGCATTYKMSKLHMTNAIHALDVKYPRTNLEHATPKR